MFNLNDDSEIAFIWFYPAFHLALYLCSSVVKLSFTSQFS